MIAWIGALSTFVGREQDAHKREEREEADGAGEQHVVFLQVDRTAFPPRGLGIEPRSVRPVALRRVT
jgi:hypothetical protein